MMRAVAHVLAIMAVGLGMGMITAAPEGSVLGWWGLGLTSVFVFYPTAEQLFDRYRRRKKPTFHTSKQIGVMYKHDQNAIYVVVRPNDKPLRNESLGHNIEVAFGDHGLPVAYRINELPSELTGMSLGTVD